MTGWLGDLWRACLFTATLLVAGCAPPAYVEAPRTAFSFRSPRLATFDALYRHAMQMGYVVAHADAHQSTFSVQSRVLQRRRGRRRGRLMAMGRGGQMMGMGSSNQLVVQVTEDRVSVSAVGLHVRDDGTMHPTLAEELETFRDSLRLASRGVVANPLNTIPPGYANAMAPPRGPGGEAVTPPASSAYGAAPTSTAVVPLPQAPPAPIGPVAPATASTPPTQAPPVGRPTPVRPGPPSLARALATP